MPREEVRPADEIGDIAALGAVMKPARFDLSAQGRQGPTIETEIEQSFQSVGDGLLTAREREIVEHTLKGHSAEAVGRLPGISPGTVRIRRRNIYAKLRISSQGELFSRFIQALGRISPGPAAPRLPGSRSGNP
jgi:DNA-binding CsgD family transcriptional regulator